MNSVKSKANHQSKHKMMMNCQYLCVGLITVGANRAKVPSEIAARPAGRNPVGRYTPGAPLRPYLGRCMRGEGGHELPTGEWNTVEIMAVGDRSLHILNGRVVNVLQDAKCTTDGKTAPLVSGRIEIESEGAECEYRRMEIRSLASFPKEYQALFSAGDSSGGTSAGKP